MWTDFHEQINDLLHEEKTARQENDAIKLSGIVTRILQIAFDRREYTKTRELLVTISKRRGQAKKPVTDMVQLCLNTFFETLPTREEKYNMILTLKEVSEGKIFLEREYSKVIRILCEMYEADGEAEKATNIIQDIQIETYGSIETKEKIEFILYQMKLVHMRRDFVRLQIMSRKLAKKQLAIAGFEHLKVEYYHFLVKYHIHEKMYLEIAKNF